MHYCTFWYNVRFLVTSAQHGIWLFCFSLHHTKLSANGRSSTILFSFRTLKLSLWRMPRKVHFLSNPLSCIISAPSSFASSIVHNCSVQNLDHACHCCLDPFFSPCMYRLCSTLLANFDPTRPRHLFTFPHLPKIVESHWVSEETAKFSTVVQTW